MKLLRQIPSIGPIRSALLVALLQTPHRFRTKRQLWAYSGFAVQTYDSGEYRFVRGKLQRNRERITVRGLNHNHNHDLKNLLKGAAISAIERPGPLQDFYAAPNSSGLDLEKTSRLRSRQNFFLDILFDRTHRASFGPPCLMSPWQMFELACLRRAPIQPQIPRNPAHRLNTQRNVRLQFHAKLRGPIHDVIPIHATREGLVFHLLPH